MLRMLGFASVVTLSTALAGPVNSAKPAIGKELLADSAQPSIGRESALEAGIIAAERKRMDCVQRIARLPSQVTFDEKVVALEQCVEGKR